LNSENTHFSTIFSRSSRFVLYFCGISKKKYSKAVFSTVQSRQLSAGKAENAATFVETLTYQM
jgi:hypothetical protein